MVTSHMQECSLGGIDLQYCLDLGKTPFSLVSCCVNLNQAVQAGYYCFCSLLGPSNPLLITKISLLFSNCYISMPSECHDSFTELPPPGIPVPVLNQPPASPLPVLMPPPSELNDLFVPLPPKVNEIPLNSTPNNSSIVDGEPTLSSNPVPKLSIPERWDYTSAAYADIKICLQLRILLLVVLCYVYIV
ncbi:uncharacterized protein Fot_42485 [Forsythia ovata]|uniref:Bifunctional inhibitor/plant lipid transfer protein/seed storage helical domain-containing protein n=1 Tax=Forsythia ovata TaxID=205694 RepID=A0ABD1RLB8_9LAMI